MHAVGKSDQCLPTYPNDPSDLERLDTMSSSSGSGCVLEGDVDAFGVTVTDFRQRVTDSCVCTICSLSLEPKSLYVLYPLSHMYESYENRNTRESSIVDVVKSRESHQRTIGFGTLPLPYHQSTSELPTESLADADPETKKESSFLRHDEDRRKTADEKRQYFDEMVVDMGQENGDSRRHFCGACQRILISGTTRHL